MKLAIAAQPDAPVLRVGDSGPGIPRDERECAFQRFYRGQRNAGDGTGSEPGLAVVANIVARHGATVALLDTALGGSLVEARFGTSPVDRNTSP